MFHRTLARIVPVALVTSLITLGPVTEADASPTSVATHRDSIPISGMDTTSRGSLSASSDTDPVGDQVVALTGLLDTQDFEVAGVTWQGERTDVEAFVRTRDAETGEWGDWSALEAEPQPAEATTARTGTQPLVTGTADGIQVRVESARGAPAGLAVDVIDTARAVADAAVGLASAAVGEVVQTQPRVRSRAEWGADESIRRGEPQEGEVEGAVVHHTAGTNDYSKAEVPGILRGIYSYHVQSLGWNDIGYNVLVDKWGRLWEGRAGGLDKAIIGAHAYGVNDETFGISALGDYEETRAPDAMVNSIEEFVAWKLGKHGVDPTATAMIGGEERPAVLGHRDVWQTLCPGRYLATEMDRIRTGAKERQALASV